MLGWDYVALLRFPFLRGPSSTKAKASTAQAQDCFFVGYYETQASIYDKYYYICWHRAEYTRLWIDIILH